jgi:hypothetical protein
VRLTEDSQHTARVSTDLVAMETATCSSASVPPTVELVLLYANTSYVILTDIAKMLKCLDDCTSIPVRRHT